MRVLEASAFKKTVKRLHANQKADLYAAIRSLMEQPTLGEQKVGDIAGVRVLKFRMVNQLALLAYAFDAAKETLTLIALGSHENFYRDLKGR